MEDYDIDPVYLNNSYEGHIELITDWWEKKEVENEKLKAENEKLKQQYIDYKRNFRLLDAETSSRINVMENKLDLARTMVPNFQELKEENEKLKDGFTKEEASKFLEENENLKVEIKDLKATIGAVVCRESDTIEAIKKEMESMYKIIMNGAEGNCMIYTDRPPVPIIQDNISLMLAKFKAMSEEILALKGGDEN